jgi:hypothetical protein
MTTIVAHISKNGSPVADVTYRAGLHVEIRVAQDFQEQSLDVALSHSANGRLRGTWEQALDRYFNEGRFDFRGGMFPGERPRVGTAREHHCLFREAIVALMKDLGPQACHIDVEFL